MSTATIRRTRWAVVAAVLLFAGIALALSLETSTSQAHLAARAAIEDPNGPVHRAIGAPNRLLLVGSTSKTLTAEGTTRTCGSNRYLVFSNNHASWVEVILSKPPNEWNWVAREVVVGWSSKPSQPC